MSKTVKRGEVWIANLEPAIGAEIKKVRPVLIIQNDIGNEYSPLTIVAAITSSTSLKKYPTEVYLSPPEGGLNKDSTILLNQIRTIDKERLIKRLGRLSEGKMKEVNQAIMISLGLSSR